MGLTAALLATAFTFGPSVSVEVVADGPHADEATALGGWLVQRLIEEGYTIAPPGQADQADQVLTLEADAEVLTVRGGTETFEIETGAPAVMRLEALHRARLLLEHSHSAQPPGQPTDSLASEVLGMRTQEEAPEGAAGALESALLEAGYVLTPRPRPGDPVLCVVHADARLGASLTRGGVACPDPTIYVAYAQLQGPHGADAIVALIEAASEPERPPAEPFIAPPGATDEPAAATPPDPPDEKQGFLSKESEFRLGADVGAVARGDVDAYARAHMRLGKLQGPGGQLHVGVIPSRSGSVRALDTTLAVGPDFRFGRRRFGAEVGLVAGALVHAYADESVRGGSASWYVGLPAAVSFGRSWDRMRVHLFTEGFITGGRLQHIRDNAPNWARSAWGVRAGLGITWGWNIK